MKTSQGCSLLLLAIISAGPVCAQMGGNPLAGYGGYTQSYTVPYANAPGFGAASPSDPSVNVTVAGSTIEFPLDTGSRALYASVDLLPGLPNPTGPTGYVYLNSSARIFQGTWSTQTVTFPDAIGNGVATPATAVVQVLVVDTLACSTTPAPGASTASTTFGTTPASGTVMLTNGQTLAFNGHQITLTGGQAVSYAQNPGVLGSTHNFGVGFDRSGQGTFPNDNQYNQQYNAFLNVAQMQANPPTMRAGYVLTQTSVQLGLTGANAGYAYTNLLPTGLTQNPPSPPDWQAPMGNVIYQETTYGTGQVVVDIGIGFSILTLPGLTGTLGAPPMTVNLINSQGAVSYQVNGDPTNLLNPSSIQIFSPLAGNFSENQPPLQNQTFNTGRNVLNAFNFLYDGVGGYIGLIPNGVSVPTAGIQFTAGFYPAPVSPVPVVLPPVIHVAGAGKGRLVTTRAVATIHGRVANVATISKVTYQIGAKGKPRKARGTVRWKFTLSPKPGKNFVFIKVYVAGQVTVERLVVIRK